MKDFHAVSVDDCLKHFKVSESKGLTSEEANTRLKEFGYNELEKEEPTPLWQLVLQQFDDILVKILLGAAVFSFILAAYEGAEGEEGVQAFVEPVVILLILIINAIVGVWQESNAEKALEALKELQSQQARVWRDGEMIDDLDARELVPGDIVEVRVGDKIPADLRCLRLKTTTFRTDEGSLTGESATVMKHTDPLGTDLKIQDKKNMMFAGTTVSGGAAIGLVVSTGMNTEIGKIQSDVQAAKEEEEKTPLNQKLDEFGEMLSKVIAGICLLVWVMNFNQFFDPVHGSFFKGCVYYLKIAVALGVAAIPEGLPAVITLCLALGTRKMVKKNAIVRRLPSVETLGCCTVICSDKTGTLTTNQMTAVSLVHFQNSARAIKEYTVTGDSYSPRDGQIIDYSGMTPKAKGLQTIAKVAALCNEAGISYRNGAYVRTGEPTEAALRVLVEKLGIPDSSVAPFESEAEECRRCNSYWSGLYEKMATLEFSRDRKSMGVLARSATSRRSTRSNVNELFVKGAPESVLARCTHVMLEDGSVAELKSQDRKVIESYVLEMARRPLRCLGIAYKADNGVLNNYGHTVDKASHPGHAILSKTEEFANVESGMVFCGVVGIKDPARKEVRSAIEMCRLAGIRVIMITGDNKETAEAIARDIGIFERNEDVTNKSFTGKEFFSFPPDKQRKLLMDGGGSRAFSRTEPRDKQQLVRLLRAEDEVPAMTGDGVNDAPALKQAAIGIAMGIAGTEVAKEASDMILTDDNFATIVAAVEEGRSIYMNMKAFIRYLISSNIGEVASIFFTAMLGLPEGLIPVQLLWVNLVTDGPPATALGFNPPDPDVMRRPPRRADDQLISGWVFFRYMVIGIYVGIATLGVFVYWYIAYDWAEDGHPLVSWDQLSHWSQCPNWEGFSVPSYGDYDYSDNPCSYFTEGKKAASTMSLSVLVTIEMLNALNALSEDASLLVVPPWCNPWLLVAMCVSFGLHFVILYVPFFAKVFSIVPLSYNDWLVVLAFSAPVLVLDEILKAVGRIRNRAELAARLGASKQD
eukprot:Rmarinus@m.20064